MSEKPDQPKETKNKKKTPGKSRKRWDNDKNWTAETTQVYGSLSYQLKEASDEAQSFIDFVWQVLKILASAAWISIILGALFVVTLFMCYFGIKYLNDCPIRKEIPLYLLVGGASGLLTVAILFIKHRRIRKDDDNILEDESEGNGDVRHTTVAYTGNSVSIVEGLLFCFLLAWFIAGNYWVFSIYKPPFSQPLVSLTPTEYCGRTVYLFAVVQICIIHSLAILTLSTVLFIICCAHRLSVGHYV